MATIATQQVKGNAPFNSMRKYKQYFLKNNSNLQIKSTNLYQIRTRKLSGRYILSPG